MFDGRSKNSYRYKPFYAALCQPVQILLLGKAKLLDIRMVP
jgi:hypothetical protein